MPSYVIHLTCAKKIMEMDPRGWNEQEQNLFCLGNIVADMCIDKRMTHFWDDVVYQKLVRRPNLNLFLDLYGKELEHPYVYGYYTHLVLDAAFLDGYWKNHFRFFGKDRREEDRFDKVCYVEVAEQKKIYPRNEFFSKELYYGDYDQMNGYFVQTYHPVFPHMNLTDAAKKDVHIIQEIDWAYAIPAIEKARQMLTESNKTNEEETEQTLRVFQLKELEILVEQIAKKMTGR